MEKWAQQEKRKLVIKKILRLVIVIVVILGYILLTKHDVFMEQKNNMQNNSSISYEEVAYIIFKTCLTIAIIVFLYIEILIFIIKKKNTIKSDELYRDIDEKYTPAIASYLIDYSVEDNKDILATILDLNVRNYLEIENNNGFIITIRNKELNNMFLHEKYIINQIKNNELIKIETFKRKIEEDCINEKLIKKNGLNILDAIVLIGTFTIPVFMGLFDFWHLIPFLLWISCIIYNIKISVNKRTILGKEIAAKFKGLKNYLKEYTLVKTRDIEYINILDRYLAYALALGEADTIEKLYVPYNILISKYIEGGK